MVTGGNDTYYGEHVVMYITVESQCCSPGTNILHVNYIQLKKKIKKFLKSHLSFSAWAMNLMLTHLYVIWLFLGSCCMFLRMGMMRANAKIEFMLLYGGCWPWEASLGKVGDWGQRD